MTKRSTKKTIASIKIYIPVLVMITMKAIPRAADCRTTSESCRHAANYAKEADRKIKRKRDLHSACRKSEKEPLKAIAENKNE